MNHQIGKKKLNLRYPHRTSLIRNQAIILIEHGHLNTTHVRAKEVKKFTEKLVTLAKKGYNFNTIRTAKSLLPYKDAALKKLFNDIAPKYSDRPGGYLRIIKLAQRISDTAQVSRLEWV